MLPVGRHPITDANVKTPDAKEGGIEAGYLIAKNAASLLKEKVARNTVVIRV